MISISGMIRLTAFLVFLIVGHSQLLAQTSLSDQELEDKYYVALERFDNQQYEASYALLSAYLEGDNLVHKERAGYLRLKSAFFLKDDRFLRVISEYTKTSLSPHFKNKTFLLGANYHFEQQNYERVLEYYESIDLESLNELDHLFFRGYAYKQTGEIVKAKSDFENVVYLRGMLLTDAAYYAGMIAYEEEDYDRAQEYLNQSVKNKNYRDRSRLALASIYMKNSNTKLLEELVLELESDDEDSREFHLLLGNYYFNKKSYTEALSHYDEFLNASLKVSDKIYYRAGLSAYNINRKGKAEEYLKVAALTEDTVAQVASYYLGIMYLEQSNYQFAANSFNKALELSFNPLMKEESMFLVGKTNVSAGNYRKAIIQLKDYLIVNNRGEHRAEANELISHSYMQSSDYEGAIAYIEGLSSLSIPIKKVYQEITLREGILLFNKSRFSSAKEFFKKSERYPVDDSISAKANYYLGESYAITRDYRQSVSYYKKSLNKVVLPTDYSIYYGLGYSLYNVRNYKEAEVAFSKFITYQPTIERYAEALVRLGDLAYVSKSYKKAIVRYDNALRKGYEKPDYLYYQKGVVFYYQRDVEKASLSFNTILKNYPNSVYFDDALFQLGQLYNEASQYDRAFSYFDRLITQHQSGPYLPEALLRRASLYSQRDEHEKAVQDFKRVLLKFPTHSSTQGALLGIQSSLIKLDQNQEFANILEEYRALNPDNDQLEQISFEAAKELYYSQHYKQAIIKLKRFVETYSLSSYKTQALFLIADAYYRLDERLTSIQAFEAIEDAKDKGLKVRVHERLAELLFIEERHDESIRYYTSLLSYADRSKDTLRAYEGLMKNYYSLAQYTSALNYGEMILTQKRVPTYLRNTVLMTKAKSFLALDNEGRAVDNLLEILNGKDQEKGAEAKFLLAKIKYDKKAFQESISLLYELKERYPEEEKWLSKSYILIAQNYMELGELLQAKATLTSIVENSPFEKDKENARQILLALDSVRRMKVISDHDNIDVSQ